MIWRYGDQICWGPFVQGNQIDGDRLSRGTKLVGDHLSMVASPWGPNFLGPFAHGDRKWGTRNPGIKWVWDQMSRSHSTLHLFSAPDQPGRKQMHHWIKKKLRAYCPNIYILLGAFSEITSSNFQLLSLQKPGCWSSLQWVFCPVWRSILYLLDSAF